MYLRLTQRRNRDGSVVRYVQLAHNHRVNGRAQAEVVANLGREDQIDLGALRGLVTSIGRYLDRKQPADPPEPGAVEPPAPPDGPGTVRPTDPGRPADPAVAGWTGTPAGLDRLFGRDLALADLPGL